MGALVDHLPDATIFGPSAADGPGQFWQAPVPFRPDAKTSPEPPLPVYLNHGRWVVACPDCCGAQYAHPTDRRFMCNECANVAIGGLWRAITWPEDRNAIETAVVRRPAKHRNWLPGESLDQLRKENSAHGLSVQARS